MTIFCKICGCRITSNNGADGQAKVLEEMSRHLEKHRPEAEGLAVDIVTTSQLIATYLLIKRHVTIPLSETQLLETFQQNRKTLIGILEDATT